MSQPYTILFSPSTLKVMTLGLLLCLCCFANDRNLPKGSCPGMHRRIKTKEYLFLSALSAAYIQGSSGNPTVTQSTGKTFLVASAELHPVTFALTRWLAMCAVAIHHGRVSAWCLSAAFGFLFYPVPSLDEGKETSISFD